MNLTKEEFFDDCISALHEAKEKGNSAIVIIETDSGPVVRGYDISDYKAFYFLHMSLLVNPIYQEVKDIVSIEDPIKGIFGEFLSNMKDLKS